MTGAHDRPDISIHRADDRRGWALAAAQRHGEDISRLVGSGASRWTDALAGEARAQIGGCLNAIETTIALGIAAPAFANIVEQLGPAYCRRAIEAEPHLLSRRVIEHFRHRAMLALVARDAFGQHIPPEMEGDGSIRTLADEPDSSGDLVALNLAETKWLLLPAFEAPLRPDLPAEIFADLAWSACALLVQACERQVGKLSRDAIDALSEATARATARYDEGAGAFALAARYARLVPQDQRRRVALLALRERRILLFAAFAAQELRISIRAVLAGLLEDVRGGRIALLKAMGADEDVALRTRFALAFADGGQLDDEGIAAFVEEYRRRSVVETDAVLAQIAGPEVLMEKLTMIARVRP